MKVLKIIIIGFLTISSLFAQKQGQELIDSLQQEIPLVNSTNDTIDLNIQISRAYYDLGDYDNSRNWMYKSLKIFQRDNNRAKQGEFYMHIGGTYNIENVNCTQKIGQ